MDKKDEIISSGESSGELNPGIQALADMADKMGEGSSGSEYNEFGFNSEGMHRNGTRYDDEGYGADGFDEDGVDREGFDREGFGSDDRDREGFDREGYGEDGYDRKGFDRAGINKSTGSEYDDRGYNREGFDEYGYDRGGYDNEGFHRNGFNREGIHKETRTEFGPNGWNQSRTIHRDTGNNYDPEGFNSFGRDRDGYNREGWNSDGWNRDGINRDTNTRFDRRGFDINGINEKTGEIYDQDGFNRSGINKETGTKYDKEGFDLIGLDKDGRDRDGFKFYNEGVRRDLGRIKELYPFLDERSIKTHPISYSLWIQHSAYNRDGFDRNGCGRDGYDSEGYNRDGFNKNGYNREGLDKDGYTEEYNAKFNKYGVDENGYMKNGELDPDVEFAISFSESGIKDQNKYAAEKGIDEKEVRGRIEAARKKCPNIDEIIKNLLLTGNKMRVAAISNDCEKFISGELNVDGFWDKHPRLNISEVLSSFINDPEKRKQFSDRTVENLVLDSDNIEGNLRIFGTSQYDVSGALKGIEDFKRIYTRFGTDGTPEQIQKKRENTKKIFDTIKYLNRYRSRNLDSLLGSRQSFDGGQTWIEFNGETIGQAMDALKKDKKLVCVQTVKDYIINQYKNPNNNF